MGTKGPRLKYFDRHMKTAVLLGFGALVLNAICIWIAPEPQLPLGNIFLFWAAAALGPHYTAIATAFGVFPEAFFHSGDYVYAVRILALCLGIAYLLRKFPKMPAFLVTAGMWLLIFLPCLLFIEPARPAASLPAAAFGEMALTLAAGLLLLNHGVWNRVAKRPRCFSLQYFLAHIIPGTVLLTMFLGLAVYLPGDFMSGFQYYPDGPLALSGILAASLGASLLLAYWLSKIVERDAQHLLQNNILRHGEAGGFSGLSSDFWRRRQSSVDVSMPPRRSDTFSSTSVPVPGALSPSEGVCALNRDGKIAFLNRLFKQVVEIKDSDPLGRHVADLTMNEDVQKCLLELLERTLSAGPRTVELKLNALPDKLRFIELSSQHASAFQMVSLRDSSDGIVIVARDITKRRAVEHHLLNGQRLASLGNIVKGIAHAFNNSLATIVGQASSGKHLAEPAALHSAFDSILSASVKAGGLVRQLLQFVEEQAFMPRNADICAFLEKHLELLNKLVGENVELKFERPKDAIGVCFDPNLVLQALSNLVINSKEAIRSRQGRIEISVSTERVEAEVADLIPGGRAGEFCRLRIRDDGEGMNSEVLAHAFDPLFTTKSNNGNAGFGLSIVYGIVRSLNGFLTLESQLGKGTNFSIYLPIVDLVPEETAVEEDKQPPLSAGNAQERILVVEDDNNVREVVSSMLQILGYRVASCSSGFEALERCKKAEFDLILADMIMPRMNGLELLTKLKEARQPAKAMIMTAYGVTADSVDKSIRVLPKPFDMDTLAQVVRESLAEKEEKHALPAEQQVLKETV